jgi:aryl-alcohol dehydrogenase-like predicted oxidoreductase
MKLGLGTVQFGLDYGITNRSGQTHPDEVRHILEHAAAAGVGTLDTAALYGNSETVLGDTLPRPHAFRIITKTLTLDPTLAPADAVSQIEKGILRSLERLKEPRLGGLLLHRVDDLLGASGPLLFDRLTELRAQGLVEKIGVSLYTPAEVDAVLSRYSPDLVQLPLNPFDQRHLESGSLRKLATAGVEIHVRSAFLQGMLLSPPRSLPPGLQNLGPKLSLWQEMLAKEKLTPLQGCLGFLRGIPELGVVICGASTLAEWMEIQDAWQSAPPLLPERLKELAIADVNLIDPRFWPKP